MFLRGTRGPVVIGPDRPRHMTTVTDLHVLDRSGRHLVDQGGTHGLDDRNRHVGVPCSEPPERGGGQRHVGGRERPDPQPSARAGLRDAEVLGEGVDPQQEVLGVRQQHLAKDRWPDPAGQPSEDGSAQPALELGYSSGHTGLAVVECLGRSGERPGRRDDSHQSQIVQLQSMRGAHGCHSTLTLVVSLVCLYRRRHARHDESPAACRPHYGWRSHTPVVVATFRKGRASVGDGSDTRRTPNGHSVSSRSNR